MENSGLFTSRRILVSRLCACMISLGTHSALAWDVPVTVGPNHLDVHLALSSMVFRGHLSDDSVEYHMAMNSVEARSIGVEDYARVELWAPTIKLGPGFRAKPDLGSGYFRAGIPVFKVNCVNMVDPSTGPILADGGSGLDNFFNDDLADPNDPDPTDHDTFRAFCENEIAILNHHFVNEDGGQLVRFRLNEVREWAQPAAGSADRDFFNCISHGKNCVTTGHDEISATFNTSSFSTREAITIVYFRHPNGDGETDSFSKINWKDGAVPWVMINYRRADTSLVAIDDGDISGNGGGEDVDGDGLLDGNGIRDDDDDRKAAHEHEIGHIFSVHHTWDERVVVGLRNDSNIMNYGGSSGDHKDGTDTECASGAQGNRAVGFWFNPRDGQASGVCQKWNNDWLDYNNDGLENNDQEEIMEAWSQVEIILYTAKHYKETWGGSE